jgi:hypothetical protein
VDLLINENHAAHHTNRNKRSWVKAVNTKGSV